MFEDLNRVYQQINSTYRPNEGLGSFQGVATFIANLLIAVAFSVSFIALAYAFIQFLTSQGDPKAIEKAQHAALYSAAALGVSLLAVAIRSIVFKSVGAPTVG